MSILIKGMDMPKECGVIVIHKEGNSFYTTKAGEGRRYPLIHISPHGRLIDADERIKAINKKADTVSENKGRGATIPSIAWFSGMSSALSIIEAAPTIIEAEEGAEE